MLKKLSPIQIVIIVIVVIGICAVGLFILLSGASVVGVQTVQTVLNDDKVRTGTQQIATALSNYYSDNMHYPQTITKTATGLLLDGKTEITFSDPAEASFTYCYSLSGNIYILGGKLNNGSYYDLGNSLDGKCSDSYQIK